MVCCFPKIAFVNAGIDRIEDRWNNLALRLSYWHEIENGRGSRLGCPLLDVWDSLTDGRKISQRRWEGSSEEADTGRRGFETEVRIGHLWPRVILGA